MWETLLSAVAWGLLGASALSAHAAQEPPEVDREAAAAREKLVKRLEETDRAYHKRTQGFTCLTGEEAREGALVLNHVLSSDAHTIRAWLALAMSGEHFHETNGDHASHWAWFAFYLACQEPGEMDPRFFDIVRTHRTMLFEAATRTLRVNNHSNYTLQHLFVTTAMWDSLPVFMEAIEKCPDDGWLRRDFTNLTWRNPMKLEWWQIEKLEGNQLEAWTREVRAWWQANRNITSTQAILATAKRWELADLNRTAGREARVLVSLLMDEAAGKSAAEADLLTVLDADWPRYRHEDETDKTAPREEAIATAYALVRDAAFLLAHQRTPEKAIAAMEAGLKRNDRVIGELEPRYLPRKGRPEGQGKARLFQRCLTTRLRADLDARIRDKSLGVATRLKWLIIRDQFFPERGVWLYDCCAKREDDSWSIMRDKLGEARESARWRAPELGKALAARRF
jgi:hypothetical protein